MAKKKKIVTIGQLKYRKRQKDMIMEKLIENAKTEGIHLSESQLIQKQKDIMKRISLDHGSRVKYGKIHAKLMKEENNSK